jgi:photosystem II stability/assembly factor-like uncharacterized protein
MKTINNKFTKQYRVDLTKKVNRKNKMKTIPMIILILVTIAFSQDSEWQFMGLYNIGVKAIAINHENESIVYTGTGSSIYKSINGGETWDRILYGVSCTDITIHPQDPDIVFATLASSYFNIPAGIIKFDSEDNWEWIGDGMNLDEDTSVLSLEIDPNHPDTMYAGTGGIFEGHVYKTINGGLNWASLPVGGNITSITINPYITDELFVSDFSMGRIFKSVDGGESWTEVFNAFELDIGCRSIYDIELDKIHPDIIYAPVRDCGLYKSINSGESWINIAEELNDLFTKYIEISPENHLEIYLGVAEYGIYKSEDGGNNWIEWNEGIFSSYIESLTIAPSGNAIYCGTDEGIFKRIINPQNNINPEKLPYTFSLKPNYPNPFNPTTVIRYELMVNSSVNLAIYNLQGQLIEQLVDSREGLGYHEVTWDATDYPSSIYFYKLQTNKISQTGKMILMK